MWSSRLAPTLKRNDTVVMDNLPAHKAAGVREAIEARRHPSLSPAIFAGSEPDRDAIQQTQGVSAQGGGAENSWPASSNQNIRAQSHRTRSQELFQARWLCVKLTGICSLGVCRRVMHELPYLPE